MAFEHRWATAQEHETAVAQAIEELGYHVKPFGQGQLDTPTREKLRAHKTPLRWLPDVLAISERLVLLIDAKAGRTDTPNYAIESASLNTLAALDQALGVPVLIVWSDMHVTRATHLKASPRLDERPGSINGSGTPFALHPKKGASTHMEPAFLLGAFDLPRIDGEIPNAGFD